MDLNITESEMIQMMDFLESEDEYDDTVEESPYNLIFNKGEEKNE